MRSTTLRCTLSFLFVLCVAAVASCGSDVPTRVSGLHGTYTLRLLDGHAVPYDAPAAACGHPCTFASGSVEILSNDTVLVRQTVTTPASGNVPGTETTTIRHLILRPTGDRFAVLPGPDAPPNLPADTLTVRGDTLVFVASFNTVFFQIRVYTR